MPSAHYQVFSHTDEWLDGLTEVCTYLHTPEAPRRKCPWGAHLNSCNSVDSAILRHYLNNNIISFKNSRSGIDDFVPLAIFAALLKKSSADVFWVINIKARSLEST